MRVVIAGDFPESPPDVVGGIQAVVYYTLEGLKDYKDLDIHLVSCEKWGRAAKTGEWTLKREGWTAHYLPSSPKIPHTLTMFTTDRAAILRKIHELAPDVIHAHGQVAAYPWAAFASGLPTLVTVHGINTLEAAVDRRGGIRGPLRAFLWRSVEMACLRRAQHIAVISPFVDKFIKPHTRAKRYNIENPVQSDVFELRRESVVPGRVLFVGSIQKRKGLLDLIRAVDQVAGTSPDVQLRVAGAFMQPYAEYGDLIKKTVQDLGLEDRVAFLGHLDRSALLRELDTCAVFCLPSYVEASSVAVAEAMAAGCPIVTTDIDAMDHLVEEGVEGHKIPPGDVGALAQKLNFVLQDLGRQQSLGRNARRTALARFSPAVAAEKTQQIYRRLVK